LRSKDPLSTLVAALRADGDHRTAAAVLACARVATQRTPLDGLRVPNEQGHVEELARRHFGLRRAQRAFDKAVMEGAEGFSRQDAIRAACLALREASDDAYFYYGLTVGLLVSSLRPRLRRVKERR
jgi:hypothetical protein